MITAVHVYARHAVSVLERIRRRESQTRAGGDDEGGRVLPYTTLATFIALRDITLEGLCIELFCPADDALVALLRRAD